MKSQADAKVQLTVRGVPARIAAFLKQKARQEEKSLNAVLLDVLSSVAESPEPALHHDLDDLSGLWEEDAAFDEAITAQDQIDEDMWV